MQSNEPLKTVTVKLNGSLLTRVLINSQWIIIRCTKA